MKNILLNGKGSLSPAYIETLKLCGVTAMTENS